MEFPDMFPHTDKSFLETGVGVVHTHNRKLFAECRSTPACERFPARKLSCRKVSWGFLHVSCRVS
jgi:hypothetical protein